MPSRDSEETRRPGVADGGEYWDCDSAYCYRCIGDDDWPGFEDWESPIEISEHDKTDVPTHCAECEDLIPQSYTPDGVEYILERLDEYDDSEHQRPEILDLWADAVDSYLYDGEDAERLRAYRRLREVLTAARAALAALAKMEGQS